MLRYFIKSSLTYIFIIFSIDSFLYLSLVSSISFYQFNIDYSMKYINLHYSFTFTAKCSWPAELNMFLKFHSSKIKYFLSPLIQSHRHHYHTSFSLKTSNPIFFLPSTSPIHFFPSTKKTFP